VRVVREAGTHGPGFDFVVVGAGTAGCALASALVEGAGPRETGGESRGGFRRPRVLLLEAGTAEAAWGEVADLGRWGALLVPGTRSGPEAERRMRRAGPATVSTGRSSVPQTFRGGFPFHGFLGRRLAYDGGRGLGGSSLVNAGLCCRPPRADLNAWARLLEDDDRWGVAHLEASVEHVERAFAPTAGVPYLVPTDSFPARLREAAASAGFPPAVPAPGDRAPDALPSRWPEVDRFTRCAVYAALIAPAAESGGEGSPHARRVSAFDAMVAPLLRHGGGAGAGGARDADLVVASGCSVERLVSAPGTGTRGGDRRRASGVVVRCTLGPDVAEVVEVSAGKDVVLCCGAIGSPMLLASSASECGPGHAALSVGDALPLFDHACVPMLWLATRASLGAQDRSLSGAQAWLHLAAEPDASRPDAFVLFVDGAMAVPLVPHLVASPLRLRCGPRMPRALAALLDACLALAHAVVFRTAAFAVSLPFVAAFVEARAVGALVGAYASHSCGSLSNLGAHGPDIDPGLLSDAKDVVAMKRGMQSARRILRRPELARHGLVECLWLLPFWLHAALFLASWFHPMSTLPMGAAPEDDPHGAADADASARHPAVDTRMRPRGWDAGVRVADASTLPRPVAVPPSLAIAALARRAGTNLAAEFAHRRT